MKEPKGHGQTNPLNDNNTKHGKRGPPPDRQAVLHRYGSAGTYRSVRVTDCKD